MYLPHTDYFDVIPSNAMDLSICATGLPAAETRINLRTICKILPTARDLTTFTLTSGGMPFKIASPFVAPLRLVILEVEKYFAGIFLCGDSNL
jgi:hypothetical protein